MRVPPALSSPRRHLSALALLGLLACGSAAAELAGAPATRQMVADTLVLPATVEATETAVLAAQTAGRLLRLHAEVGERVRRGQRLAQIDAAQIDARLDQAHALVREAVAAAREARAHAERTRDLHRRQFVSQAARDAADAALVAAQSRLAAAQAGAAQASVLRDEADIRAPFDGVVTERHLEAGETVQPGQRVLTLQAPERLRATAQIPHNQVPHTPLSAARIEWPEAARWFEASTLTLFPAADPRTHTLTLRAGLPAGSPLTPGQFVRLHLVTGHRERLMIPASAILRRGELTAVYVLDDGQPRLRQIRLGSAHPPEGVEVLAGLLEGETVALDPVRAGLRPQPAAAR